MPRANSVRMFKILRIVIELPDDKMEVNWN
jgi:hypothetical protein